MKKLILLMLVAMVPYFTMAQKRSKKNKKVETVVKNNASYEFMVITGFEMMMDSDRRIKGGPSDIPPPDVQLKMIMQSNSKVIIQFDFGGNNSEENILLSENRYKSMSHAVNGAANNGWGFISSDVIVSGTVKIHYYYMKKIKKK